MTDLGPYLGKGAQAIPISNSEIQVYKECRRKWWLSYYRGLRRSTTSLVGPLPLGTRVHAALEAYHKNNDNPVDEYVALFDIDKEVFENSAESMLDEVNKKFYSEGELGRIMVEGYMEWLEETGLEADYEIIDVEQANRFKVLDGRVELVGKMDVRLLSKNEDATYIGDIKTAAQFTMYDQTAHMSEQLMLYTMLERLSNNGNSPANGGLYLVLKKVKRTAKAKPPFYKQYIIRFNDATLNSFWIRMHGQLKDMLATRDALDNGADHRYVAYPTPTKDCSWKCPFYSVCPMFDDGSSAEMWIDQYTQQNDPYQRYEDVESE